VICSTEEDKVGYKTEASSVGSLVENCLWEGTRDKMEVGGSSLNNLVAKEGAHLDCFLNLQDHFSEGLLLQDKDRDVQGELERCESMIITPLDVEDGEGQRVSPRWVVEIIKRSYPIIGLSCGGLEDKLLAVFEEIEAARDRALAAPKTNYLSSQGAKGQMELNRLAWSINYEKKGAHSNKGRHKGRVSSRLYEA
jgi:hypothetical protein